MPGSEDVPAPPAGVNRRHPPSDLAPRQLVIEAPRLLRKRPALASDPQNESVALRLHRMQQFGLGAVRKSRQQAIRIEIALDPAQQRAVDRRFDKTRQVELLTAAVREPQLTRLQVHRTHEEGSLHDLDLASKMPQPNDVFVLVCEVFDRTIEMFAQLAVADRLAFVGEAPVMMQDETKGA